MLRFFLAAFLFISSNAIADGPQVNQQESQQANQRIVAIVNSVPISAYDVMTRTRAGLIASNVPDTPALRKRFAPQTLQTLIDETLQQQVAEQAGVNVPDDAINEAFAGLAKQNRTTPAALQQKLASKGLSVDLLRQQVKSSLVWGAVVQREMGQQVKIETQDINNLKNQLRANAGKPEVRFQEIYLSDMGEHRGTSRETLQTIRQQLQQGADFTALAKQFSDSNANTLGDWQLLDDLEPTTAATVSRLKPGTLSPIVKVPGGYAIFLLQSKRLVGVRGGQTAGLVNLHQLVVPNEAGGEQKAGALAKQINSCATAKQVAQVEDLPLSGNLGTLKASELPEGLGRAVQSLAVGQSTPPIPMKKAFLVLTKCTTPAGASSATPNITMPSDKAIRAKLRNERLTRFASQYLEQLRRDADIEVRGL